MHDASKGSSAFHLLVTPERAALVRGEATTVRVLVRVQAPDPQPDQPGRAPLHFAMVIDRSGSMNGAPLEEAKRCARYIVDSLSPGDRAAVFAFDDEVSSVAPLTPAAERLGLAAAIATVTSGGSTNLHAGWLAGAEALAEMIQGDDVHRVILLSDGCANAGETDLETIAAQCKSLARRGVTTSTYGLGHDFNESLMLAMASAGRGNAYFGQTAADLAEPFAAEFALLTSLSARGLVLKVNAPADVRVKLRNDYEPVEDDALSWRLPDLAFASEAWALIEMEIPATNAEESTLAALPITLSIRAATQDSAPLFLMTALAPIPLVDRATWQTMPVDELLARRVLELDAADTLEAVRAAIEADDWTQAKELVEYATARFAEHPWASAVLATMKRLIEERDKRFATKEAAFARRSMSNRLSERDEPKFCVEESAGIPAFLRRKVEQGKGKPEE